MRYSFEMPKEPPKEAPKRPEAPKIARRAEPAPAAAPRKPVDLKGMAELEKKKLALETVVAGFFENNPMLKTRFENDPETMRNFRAGLVSLMEAASKKYEIAPADLPKDERFQKELVIFSFAFEEQEAARKRAGRKSA